MDLCDDFYNERIICKDLTDKQIDLVQNVLGLVET